jgi:hypothetical protein
MSGDELAFHGASGHLRSPWGPIASERCEPDALDVGFAGRGWFRLRTPEAWFVHNVVSNLARTSVGGAVASTYR